MFMASANDSARSEIERWPIDALHMGSKCAYARGSDNVCVFWIGLALPISGSANATVSTRAEFELWPLAALRLGSDELLRGVLSM